MKDITSMKSDRAKNALKEAKKFLSAAAKEERKANKDRENTGEKKEDDSLLSTQETLLAELLDGTGLDEGEEVAMPVEAMKSKVKLVKQSKECRITVSDDGEEVIIETPDVFWCHRGPKTVLN